MALSFAWRIGFGLLAAFVMSGPAFSEPLTLQECLRRALASSPTLEQAAVRVDMAQEKLDEARSKLGLSFELKTAFGVVPNDDEGNGIGPFVRNELTLTQPLTTFGKV